MAQNINVDVTPNLFQPTLYYHQGDIGRAFTITISTKDGYTIPSGATVKIEATKPSGLGFSVSGTLSGNVVSFVSTEGMTDEYGRFPAQLKITSGNDILYTANFLMVGAINTHPASVTDGTAEQVISEITLLVERAETAASTAATDAANAAQARVDEMMDYLPSEVSDLKSALKDNMLQGYKVVGMTSSLFVIGSIAEAGYEIEATNRIRIVYGYVEKRQKNFVVIPSNSYKIRFFGYSQSLTDNRYLVGTTPFFSCGAGNLIHIPDNYKYVRYVIGKTDDSNMTQSDIDYIAENIIRYDVSTDSTLTKEEAPADAKAVGDAIDALSDDISGQIGEINQNEGLLYQFVDILNPYFSEKYDGNRISVERYGVLGGAFIKFDSITFLGQGGFVKKTWADFKSDVQNDQYVDFSEANDHTPDTFRLFNGSGIIYNKATNKFRFRVSVYMTPLTVDDVVMLYVDDDGNCSGILREIAKVKQRDLYLNYKGEVSNRISDVLNGDKFTFAFATDCHWWFDTTTGYINRTNDVVNDLYNSVRYDAYINGGDSIYYGTKFKQNAVSSMEQAFDVPTENMIYCVGNHDYNGVSVAGTVQNESWMLSDDEYEAIAMRKMKNIHRPDGARYYYRDFEDKKIRVISLDTSDMDISFDANGDIAGYDPLVTFAVRQDQLEWLRTTALDCPDNDWGVIVVMHVGLYTDEDGFVDNNPLINSSYLAQLLSAYVNKSNYNYSDIDTAHGNYFAVSASGTFANAKGHLVGVWSGHAHADGYCNKDGFNAIQTECGYSDSTSRVVGTIDEVCVDCVTVDMAAKKVILKRIGVGSDREYTFV